MQGKSLKDCYKICGLVFAGGKHSLTASEIGIFRNMLAFDQLRGDHSTGLFGLFNGLGEEREFRVRKDTLEGVDFVRSPLFFDAISRQVPGALATSPKVTNYARVMFGHNRYATMGEVNARNAHPFTHGKITLAHNGTLRNQSLLPESNRFKVDSENICYAIDKLGIAETVKLLDGAFALIWYNDAEQTLNFLRNDEREFHLFETTTGDWFGCSEEKMGDWLLTRGKTKKYLKQHFELTPGVQYVFDVSRGCAFKEEVKHELPTFRSQYMGYSSGWGYTGYSRPAQQTQKPEGQTKAQVSSGGFLTGLFQQHGKNFKKHEVVPVEYHTFRPYKGSETKGMMVGWLYQEDDYIETHVHGINLKDFVPNREGFFEIISAFENKSMLTLIGKDVDEADVVEDIEEEEVFGTADQAFLDSVLDDVPEDVRVTESGERFTEAQWRTSRHNTCAACDNPIPFEDVDNVIILNGYSFCGDCGSDNDYPTNVVVEKPLGWCDVCGEVHNVYVRTGNMTPAKWADLSSACPVKAKYAEKFKNSPAALPAPRTQLSLPKGSCTACGEEVAVYKLKGGICTKCREKFQQPVTTPSKMVINSVADAMKLSGEVCPHCKWTHTDDYLMGRLSDKHYDTKAHKGCPVVAYWAGQEAAQTAELKTKSRMTVTKFAWENMNECSKCKSIIPFRHASVVSFEKGYVPLCIRCTESKAQVKDVTDE